MRTVDKTCTPLWLRSCNGSLLLHTNSLWTRGQQKRKRELIPISLVVFGRVTNHHQHNTQYPTTTKLVVRDFERLELVSEGTSCVYSNEPFLCRLSQWHAAEVLKIGWKHFFKTCLVSGLKRPFRSSKPFLIEKKMYKTLTQVVGQTNHMQDSCKIKHWNKLLDRIIWNIRIFSRIILTEFSQNLLTWTLGRILTGINQDSNRILISIRHNEHWNSKEICSKSGIRQDFQGQINCKNCTQDYV